MKAYNQLTEKEQAAARKYFFGKLLADVANGMIQFSDTLNENDLQAKIDRRIAEAESMQTPWFAGEYIMSDEDVAQELIGMASCNAEDALYLEEETAVHLFEIKQVEETL